MIDIKNKKLIYIVVAVIILCGLYFLDFKNKDDEDDFNITKSSSQTLEKNYLDIYICGEVNRPGCYLVLEGSMIGDVINDCALGFTENANLLAINLVEEVYDKQQILIPNKIDNTLLSGKLNLNTCSKDELMLIPGIKEGLSNAIITYRSKTRFTKVDDLLKIPGIGEKTFVKIKYYFTV